jgi:L-ascorbate metabolism protein UlaG (beta-lactamase superfamily)
MTTLSIKLLNHASVVLRFDDVAFVTDPWYSGGCFRNGWGLRFHNPSALDEAAACTHLWISHFHSDHFHVPTLAELAQKNPALQVLTNPSANFDTRPALEKVGFQDFLPLPECQPRALTQTCSVERVPVSGIDNMLIVRLPGWTILNYNDCNLPAAALHRHLRRIGPVDLLLLNFNHAGKLIGHGDVAEVRRYHKEIYRKKVELIRPRYVLPFASLHCYRSEFSLDQNPSMLLPADLKGLGPAELLELLPGDTVTLTPGGIPAFARGCVQPTDLRDLALVYTKVQNWDELVAAGDAFCRSVRHAYLGWVDWVQPVQIWVRDHARLLRIDLKNGASAPSGTIEDAHIESHSGPLLEWWSGEYSTVAFHVGAHYRCLTHRRQPIKRLFLASGLKENKVCLLGLTGMLVRSAGLKFLWNRRDEILALLRYRKVDIESRF